MGSAGENGSVRIELLGGLRVVLGSDTVVDAWPGRRAADVVALLALADGHRLARDRVIEALWPTLDVDAGAANLRKAAHHARQALGTPDAVVLRGGQVALFPTRTVETDAAEFESAARAALAGGDNESALALYGGDLLPDSRYEEWTQTAREHLRALHLELLRRSGQWERVVRADPVDEHAYRELMEAAVAAGRRPEAIRWYGRLRTALRRELGLAPSSETEALYDACVAGLQTDAPALIGRQVELVAVTALLRGAAGSALAIRGAGGIGKTAFCRELARIARDEGWLVVGAEATEARVPYAPIVAAVEQLLARDRSILDTLGTRVRAVLAELTALAGPAEPPDAPLTRHDVIGAFRRLLVTAGGGAPVVLIVDDTHLADEATIDLLLHIGGGAERVLAVLAYRPEPVREPLVRGIARMVRAGRATEIDLAPLDREDAAALVAAATPTPRAAEVVDRIVDLAQGNPFLTLEAARSAVAGVPALLPSARNAIASRFLDLDAPTLGMLERLALAGDALDPAGVVALTDAPEVEAFGLLDAALDAGVLVVTGLGYRFRHELVRQAIVDELPPHRQLALHRETAQRLAEAGGEPGMIARHWIAGGRPEAAREWLLAAAAGAVSLGAFRDALAHLDALLEHEPGHARALVLRAEALDVLGEASAPAAYVAAARAADAADVDDLRAKQGLAMIKLGDAPGGLEVIESIEPRSVEGRLAHALALCGAAALGYIGPELGSQKAAEARSLALRSDDPAALVVASWANAAAAHARGDLRTSIRADLRDTEGMPRLAVSVFDGQLCMTQRLLYGAQPYDDVIEFADTLTKEAERLGSTRGQAFGLTIRGEAKLLAGQLDEADADLRAGAALHHDIAAVTGEAFALQRRADVALYRGRHDEALALLDEALVLARESDVGFHLFDRIYGAKILAAADPQAALAALEEADAAVRGPAETCPGCRITLAVPAAIAAARAGELERAGEWLAQSEYLASVVMKLPGWDAAVDEARGHLAHATGDANAAVAHFENAARVFGASGHPLDAARCTELAAHAVQQAATH